MMRCRGDRTTGLRARAQIILLWRAGLRISEAVALAESDLDPQRGSILVRRGKGGRRREVGMDAWAWEHVNRWVEVRLGMPIGALLCVIGGPTAGRPWSPTAARATLRHLAAAAGVRRRFAPHQLRHAHAVEMAREGVRLVVISASSAIMRVILSSASVLVCRERGHDACASRRSSRPLKIFRRPIWPLLAASSRWRWRVGRNSCVVWK